MATATATQRLTRGEQCFAALWPLIVACCVLLAWLPVWAAPTAGSAITNQATATFLDGGGSSRSNLSNVVQVAVGQVASFALAANTTLPAAPGATLYFPHTLTNTGNGADSFALAATALSGGLSGLQIFADADGNGLPDNATPLTSTGSLPAGAVFRFVVAVTVPGTATDGSTAQLRVDATSAFDASRTTAGTNPPIPPLIDTVNVVGQPVLGLVKSVSNPTPAPGSTVTYRLTLRNSGASAAVSGPPITIDGAAASPVLVRDAIPPNTTFAAFVLPTPAGTTALYHRVGDADQSYTTAAPADLRSVDAVALAVVSVAPGAALDLSFSVTLNANAARNGSGQIVNTATAAYSNGVTPGITTVQSNPAVATLAPVPAAIRNYTGPGFATLAPYARLGSPLYLLADAAACNTSAAVVETRTVVITGPNGERETFTATETGTNTGVFALPPVPTRDAAVVAGDGVVEAKNRDTISIEVLGCGTRIVTQVQLVDPAGVVFDSRSNLPVAGATVALLQGNGAGGCTATPASVSHLNNGAIETAPSSVLTGADGRYVFELTPPGDYCLSVTPPAGYGFPSVVPVAQLPAGRFISSTGPTSGGSYGGNFIAGPTTGPVTVDVPLDTQLITGLFLQKTASRQTAEIADFVDYNVQVRNNGSTAIGAPGVTLTDNLPAGFAYQLGTARLNGQLLADPLGGRGPRLVFNLGPLAPGVTSTLSYRVRIGPGALQGDGINRAQASFGASQSNPASALVKVSGGVFSDRGYIVGRVYLDCNRNRVVDDGELGIPGVRVYLEDGTSALTDNEGKYSFYGVTPRTHVLKLDLTSMPAGSELINLSNRNAGDAGSTFVDLKNGELFKANFAEGSCQAAIVEEVKARRERAELSSPETVRTLGQRMEADATPRAVGDVKAQPASGLAGASLAGTNVAAPVAGFTPVAPRPPAVLALPPLTSRIAPPPPSVEMEKLLPALDNAFGFVDLKDRDTMAVAQTYVRIKGQLGSEFKLAVNGVDVPASRVGKKSVLEDKQLQAWEYIGVALAPGDNTLTARQLDQFGNERGRASIVLIAPDKLGKLELVLPSAAIADGQSAARIIVKLTDASGVPVTARTPITLESSSGAWGVEDLDPREPGVQVFIEGGRGEFPLVAPDQPQQALIRVTSGVLKAEGKLDFLPNLRPMIAAGVIEGVLNLRKLDSHALVPARQQDGFEQQLRQLAYTSGDGKADAAARAALFLKGKVKGDYLLTLAYDSDKETRERLFRDIQPDEFYPVYGDSAVRAFDAQSTSKLYVRIDKDKSYLLYGDFTTQGAGESRKLATYSRSLTGVREHYENERVSVNAFASRDSTKQIIDELRANGTSGPFALSTPNALENSEKVEILVRDRSQPAIVLSATLQSRFIDYEVEPLTGQIIFKGPIPSLDPNFNPRSIRVTYEVDQGGPAFWVAGVDAQVKVTDRIELGAIAVEDRNPQDHASLRGANATVKVGENTYVTGELAQSSKESTGTGQGRRIEVRHDEKGLQALAYVAKTDIAFDNPGSYITQGRAESGGKISYKLNDKTLLRGEALRTEDASTGARTEGEFVSVERSLGDHVRAEIGLRHGAQIGTPATATPITPAAAGLPNEFTSIKGKLSGQVPGTPEASVFAEYEQDIQDSNRRVAALGGEYQIASHGRVYLRHEFISSLSGPYALNAGQQQNATVVGLDGDYMKDGHVFSEYRVRDAFSGGDTEAAIGLRNLWSLADGVRLSTAVERVHVVNGIATDESAAVALGLEYTANPLWKGSARLELRDATTSRSIFSTLGLAAKLNSDWTFLGRDSLAITRNLGSLTGERRQNRLQAGLAWRDTATDVWNGLGRIEHRSEYDDTQVAQLVRRTTELLTFNLNYQPTKPLVLTGRYAGKWVRDDSNGLASRDSAHLIGMRATYDLSRNWDLGVMANTLFSSDGSARQVGLGAEAGYLVGSNLWLSAGYNVFGFSEKDLAGADYTNRGAFVRLRFKFDETLFSAKDAAVNNSLAPGGER